MMKTKLKLSTAFHPQTDGQTERTNRTVEQILRCYIDYDQTNWDDLLILVEFAINSHRQTSTDHSPFYLNYGFNPRTPDEAALPDSPYPEARHSAAEIQAMITLVKDLLAEAQEQQKALADQHHEDISFAPGDQVLLRLLQPLDLHRQRPSSKFNPRHEGPFTVTERIGQVAYRLDLPHHMHLHPTFHVSRLKKYVPPETFSPDRDVPP